MVHQLVRPALGVATFAVALVAARPAHAESDRYYRRTRGVGIFHSSRLLVGALVGAVPDLENGMITTPGATRDATMVSLGFDGAFLGLPSSFGHFHGIELSTGVRVAPFDWWLSAGTAVTLFDLGEGGPLTVRVGWQLGDASAAPVADARDLVDLVGRRGGVAARFGATLRLGRDWRDVELAGGEIVAMGGTYRRLWVATSAGMFSRSTAWSRIDGLPATPPTAIAAHAAEGAWLVYDDELCHAAIAPPILIHGLRPFERRRERIVDLELAFVGHAETTTIVELDGAEIATAEIDDGVARLPELALGGAGWHALSVRAADQERLLDYYILPGASRSWAVDIEPMFRAYCAGGPCHGPAPGGNRPDLSSYEGWQSRATQIRSRLLAGTMPPTDPRPTPAELDVILEWIEGGRLP